MHEGVCVLHSLALSLFPHPYPPPYSPPPTHTLPPNGGGDTTQHTHIHIPTRVIEPRVHAEGDEGGRGAAADENEGVEALLALGHHVAFFLVGVMMGDGGGGVVLLLVVVVTVEGGS